MGISIRLALSKISVFTYFLKADNQPAFCLSGSNLHRGKFPLFEELRKISSLSSIAAASLLSEFKDDTG